MTTCIDRAWLERHPEFLAAVGFGAKVQHPIDRAHPYPPGSGPPGQSCGTCAKLCSRTFKKTYFKCHVLMRFWTAGRGTDIRKKDPACMSWEPRIDKVEPISTLTRSNAGQYPQLAPSSPMRRRMRRRTDVQGQAAA
jgi:hypothetical protein